MVSDLQPDNWARLAAWAKKGYPRQEELCRVFDRLGRKYSELARLLSPGETLAKQSPFVRCKDARIMLGGRSILERCERAGWLTPVRRGKRMTLYRHKDVLAALQRVEWGELD